MALSNVTITDTDNNLAVGGTTSTQKISGLLFDIGKQSNLWTAGAGLAAKSKLFGKVIEVNKMSDLADLGITKYTGVSTADLMFGIPYYHIAHFFAKQGDTGRLFIAFADCTSNWDIIDQMQRTAERKINQLGIYTEQPLWSITDDTATTYNLNLVGDLQTKALAMQTDNAPLSILLSANSAIVKTSATDQKTVDLTKIPTCIKAARFVSVLLGQSHDDTVAAMQLANTNCTPIGTVGAAVGCCADASVEESIACVRDFELSAQFPSIEMGFGDMTIDATTGKFTSTLLYSSLNSAQLDALEDKGYIFLCQYAGLEWNVYFTKDRTCSSDDYRTIARNRTINKSRRAVRVALLPYINSPLLVDPTTGYLSSAKITVFKNIVTDILSTMKANGEISGYTVTISSTQNVIQTDTLQIDYTIVPLGEAENIAVTEGLSLTGA